MAEPPIDQLKAIAHPLRYAILEALAGQERNVGEIEAVTGIGQPTLSQQLSVLRNAGLVDARREAKLVFYVTNESALATVRTSLDRLVVARPGKPSGEPVSESLSGAAVFARLT